MKILSLKLDDKIFKEAEEITSKMKLARNRYINEAVNIYNKFNKRRLLRDKLISESTATRNEALEILREFEKFVDEDQAI